MRIALLVLLLLLGAAVCPGAWRTPDPRPGPASSEATSTGPPGSWNAAASPPASLNAAPSPPLSGMQAEWRLRWRFSFHNPGPGPASVRLEVPLPRDHQPWQEVRELALTPRPAREETDPSGNRRACYRWSDVPPGATVRGELVARVRRRALASNPDARRARIPGPGDPDAGAPPPDPALAGAARDLVGGETNPYYRLVHLYDFVRALDFQLTGRPRGDREALRSRVVQCADAAELLAGLARSLGIPARTVAGVYLRPDEPTTRKTHAWVEAWIGPDGWVPLDPTMGRFEDTRTSRLGQLDPNYVAIWEGPGARGFTASGSEPGNFDLVLSHELVDRRPPSSPLVPVPSLTGPRDLSKVIPSGRARGLLDRALAEPERSRRLPWIRQALELEPDSMALYRALVRFTPEGPPRAALEAELEARPPTAATLFARALLAMEDPRWSRAEALLGRAGNGFAVQHARAELFLRTGQPGRAAEALGAATREAVTLRLAEEATTLLGDLGDPVGLAEVAGQACRAFPRQPAFQVARAEALFRLGDEAAARQVLDGLRREDPTSGTPDLTLGFLVLEAWRPDEALPLLLRGLQGRLPDREREYGEDLVRHLRALGPPGRQGP